MRDPNLLVFSIPSEVSKTGGNLQVFAIPVLQRDGGFLVALPVESFSNEALETAAHADEHELLGPSHTCVAQLSEEDENGQEVMIDQEILVLLVDVSNQALQALREYDPSDGLTGDDSSF